MIRAFKTFQIFLLLCGVFGADEDEVKSVMMGDSVTLNTGLSQTQTFNLIKWWFGGSVIAQTDGKDISYPSHTEIFRNRLLLDQTGSLTIKNMRTKHSGLYKLQISHDTGTTYRKYNVTVYEPASNSGKAEIKSLSEMEGTSVTLQTDVTELQGDELIVWRFGDEGKLIAEHDIEAKSLPLYNTDERFRDRLKLDQTGSLIITNTRTNDSGFYSVKISSNKQTSYKSYAVTISARPVPVPDSGYSGGAVAGIVVGVLLVCVAVAAVMYYFRPRTIRLPSKSRSVTPGDTVTLNPDTEIKTGDEIQWKFKETLIAEIKGENRRVTTYDSPHQIFKNKFILDRIIGSLTITDTTTECSELYTLRIRRGRQTFYQEFNVSVESGVELKLHITGDDVTLKPDKEIQRDDQILWIFGDQLIAQIKGGSVELYDGPDGRFKNKLKLEKTGSLTITNISTQHDGLYNLQIISSRKYLFKKFRVSLSWDSVPDEERKKLVKENNDS